MGVGDEMSNKAVFLDRDGVLNRTVCVDGVDCPPEDASRLVFFPEAKEAVKRLRRAGFLCICVTNQPDIARGTRSAENVAEMNHRVRAELNLDDLFMCPHDNHDNCTCRKPKPGMLLSASKKWNLDLPNCWMIGDRRTDILAGLAGRCRTILINNRLVDIQAESFAHMICPDIGKASDFIIDEIGMAIGENK